MGLFGSGPVDFEAQIAEINASAERRRAILTQIAREKEAGARASAQLKALRSKKLASQKKAVRKLGQVPSAPAVMRPIPSRLKEMAEDFYEPDPRSPRLSQNDGRVLRRQAQAFSKQPVGGAERGRFPARNKIFPRLL